MNQTKRKKKKTKFSSHAKTRLKERCELVISNLKILDALKDGIFTSVKKLSNTRRLMYGIVDDCPIKLIYSKSSKRVVTILPINYDFSLPLQQVFYNSKTYYIQIFPDCYVETNDPKKLTIFKKFNEDNELIDCKIGKDFYGCFNIIWENYWYKLTGGKVENIS